MIFNTLLPLLRSPTSVNTSVQSSEDSMQQGSLLDEEDDDTKLPRKRIAINESNITRYHKVCISHGNYESCFLPEFLNCNGFFLFRNSMR